MLQIWEWGVVGVVLLLIAILSIRKNLLDLMGIVIGFIVSIFVAEKGGLGSFFAIIVFFLVGEAITRYTRKIHQRKTHERRSTVNIIGNIGPALIALAFNPVLFNVAFFGSLAAAFGDTLSSEIGVLSKERPLLITTLKPANAGEDGAVSLLGFMAAAVGGLLFGIIAFIVSQNWIWIPIMLLAGVVGSAVDSYIGATLQKDGFTDNNSTNFLAALIVGIIFALLF
ncbi:MAG: DUF92 domain-containing protein [Candidatus Iainarchaeum archaeon]|uniref:DUF92 domain-containing protein n=1 Tax=Candidatus Iainarchaeum sp. TaxID=3101447 RepID=A0A7T9DK91_9ARCH|nr:MAG: DUF92 domain-containing protein [Candidatus Diapherotrites archaeon]